MYVHTHIYMYVCSFIIYFCFRKLVKYFLSLIFAPISLLFSFV